MSYSASESIPYVVEFIRKNKPNLSTVLDIGVGFGKNGFLLRDCFDANEWHKFKPNEWELRITGVDIYEGYLSELQKLLYTEIVIGDIVHVLPSLGKFDLAIFNDVLEHLPKEEGKKLLKDLFTHVEDIVIATYNGFYEHPGSKDNPYEEHKSGWTIEDFTQYTIIDKAIVKRIRKPEELLVVYLRK